jgi:tellurite methyltransferase
MQISETAVDAWDKRWGTDAGRADWLDPHPEVTALLPELKARGASTALDLGCGVGRHALLLAESGFAVEAFDGSATGLDVLRETAARASHRLQARQRRRAALWRQQLRFCAVVEWDMRGNTGCFCRH